MASLSPFSLANAKLTLHDSDYPNGTERSCRVASYGIAGIFIETQNAQHTGPNANVSLSRGDTLRLRDWLIAEYPVETPEHRFDALEREFLKGNVGSGPLSDTIESATGVQYKVTLSDGYGGPRE